MDNDDKKASAPILQPQVQLLNYNEVLKLVALGAGLGINSF